MKLFVLLSRFPYPLEKGDKLRAYHQIKELSKNHEIHLCCLTDQPVRAEWETELEPFCASISIFNLSKPLIYWNTAIQLFSDKPYQVGYFYQSGINRKIQQKIQEIQPDHIYCQLIRTAEYVKNIHNIPKTIDYQDALSKGMFRRAATSKGFRKRMFLSEGKRLSEYENRIFDFFDHHVIISDQDRELINHPSRLEIAVVENGISEDFVDFKSEIKPAYDLVFTGNMNYPPNIQCAEFIAHNILPELPQNVSLVLAGASPHQKVQDLHDPGKIEVTGWIDDIREAYLSGKIFVAPLFIGTGLQNKLLEAMALGLPCITTSLVNNALNAKDGEHLLIADTAEAFRTLIRQLLENSELRESLSIKGREFVKENFSWEKSVRKLEAVFETKS
ncbi:MAG: glycosyltransferase [Crocinitomicaceae bacterium]|nr:glycosyltransferase [Crocinitomicaceae bacterium]